MSFLRILKFSIQDIVRNASLSVMTVIILILTLLSVNALMFVRVLTDESIAAVKNEIDVSIFIGAEAGERDIDELQTYLASFPEVIKQTFISKEDVLEEFKTIHADNAEILAALGELGGNPLGPTLVVKTREPGDYKKIIEALEVPEYARMIEAKTFADTQTAIERISTITAQVEQFSVMLTALFAVIAFIIIFNTVRVAIYTQRSEIGIKRLVGATSWFIRGPYVFESFIFSLVSLIVASAVVYFAAGLADPKVALIFGRDDVLTEYLKAHILLLALAQFGAVFLLTLLSSSLAMRKYLKV